MLVLFLDVVRQTKGDIFAVVEDPQGLVNLNAEADDLMILQNRRTTSFREPVKGAGGQLRRSIRCGSLVRLRVSSEFPPSASGLREEATLRLR